MRWVLLFLRIAIPSGVIFGVIAGLIQDSARDGLVQGAIFGGLMGLVLVATTAARTRGRAPELSTQHHMDVLLAQPPAAALDEIVAVLARFGATNIVRTDNHVTASTGTSWFSWGEQLAVEVRPDNDASIAAIISRPRIRTTMTDYGRNRDNVERLVVLLGGFPIDPNQSDQSVPVGNGSLVTGPSSWGMTRSSALPPLRSV